MTTKSVLQRALFGGALGFALSITTAGCGGAVRDSGSVDGGGATGAGATSGGGGSSAKGGGAGKSGGTGVTGGGKAGGGGTVATGATGQGAGAGKAGGAGMVGGGGTVGAGGGKAGGAGTTGKAGSGGTVGSGGTISKGGGGAVGGSAGGPICPAIPCPPISCSSGSFPYQPPGACCPSCTPDCSVVDCSFPQCGPSEVAVFLLGQCCAVCRPRVVAEDGGLPCDQSGYLSLRRALEEKYTSASCMTDAECTVVSISQCGVVDCGTAMPGNLTMSFASNLSSYSQANCGGCAYPPQTCPPLSSAWCFGGHCQLGPRPLGR